MIVKDAACWQEMDGDTELEKKLNSYLTVQFAVKEQVPSDECLDEAREIIKLFEQHLILKF